MLAAQTTGEDKPNQVCTAQLPFRRGVNAERGAHHLVQPLIAVYDGRDCFRATANAGVRERIVMGGGASSARRYQRQAANILLGNLKTALAETYHALDPAKCAPRHQAALQCRFNRRSHMRSTSQAAPRMSV